MRKCRNKSTLETLLVFLPRFCWVISRRLVGGGQFFPGKQRRTEPLPLPRFWSQNWRIKKGGKDQEERRPPAALLAAQFSFLRSRDCSFIPSPKADRGGRKDLIREEKRRKRRKKRETSMLQKARRIESSVPFPCPFLSFFVLPLFSLSASPINKRTREMRETRKENQSEAGVSPSSLGVPSFVSLGDSSVAMKED